MVRRSGELKSTKGRRERVKETMVNTGPTRKPVLGETEVALGVKV